eukprot:4108221-Amphidinium_carterae.1
MTIAIGIDNSQNFGGHKHNSNSVIVIVIVRKSIAQKKKRIVLGKDCTLILEAIAMRQQPFCHTAEQTFPDFSAPEGTNFARI